MSKSYEIYKNSVGGVTFSGEKMKLFYELPQGIRDAWSNIDNYYNEIIKRKDELNEEIKFIDKTFYV